MTQSSLPPSGSAYGSDRQTGSADPEGQGVEGVEAEPAAATGVFGDRIGLARRYAESLAIDGVVRGLIGPREPARLWSRHLMNSAVAGSMLTSGSRIVDIGSGAGLPGIPLAISRPDCEFVLIEPLERRTIYLAEVIADLGLTNCQVMRGRADQLIAECGEADVATSRAVAPLDRLAAWSAPLLRVGGELLALKGSSALEEIERDAPAAAAVGLVDLQMITVGQGIVDPPTVLIKGRRIAVNSPRRSSGPRKGGRSAGRPR